MVYNMILVFIQYASDTYSQAMQSCKHFAEATLW